MHCHNSTIVFFFDKESLSTTPRNLRVTPHTIVRLNILVHIFYSLISVPLEIYNFIIFQIFSEFIAFPYPWINILFFRGHLFLAYHHFAEIPFSFFVIFERVSMMVWGERLPSHHHTEHGLPCLLSTFYFFLMREDKNDHQKIY